VDYLEQELEDSNYIIISAFNGQTALEKVQSESPDLILLDIMMPDMDGYEVCRRIKANPFLSDIPIIFISALNETNDVVKALKSGGVDYVTKPFQAEEVIARVHTHVRLYRQSIELQNLNITKDKFFSIIAHDLKGPMGGFKGMTELLAEYMPSMSMTEVQENLALLRDSSTNLFRLLENLLQWARLQQGSVPFDPETIYLESMVNESVGLIQELAKHKGIEITQDIPGQLKVFADNNMLQTIIRNLLSNAVKFSSAGGKVSITAKEADDKSIEISIKDTGIGMTQEMIANLFRLDSRSGRTGTAGEPSTGLGLLLCKEFIEKNGGKIRVESEVGKGSIFTFFIPESVE